MHIKIENIIMNIPHTYPSAQHNKESFVTSVLVWFGFSMQKYYKLGGS